MTRSTQQLGRAHGCGFPARLDDILLGMVVCLGPFVGNFIARISKGRTVREFTIFVLIPPMVLCLLWFGAFGGTAFHQHTVEGYTGVTENVAAWKLEIALFKKWCYPRRGDRFFRRS